MAQRRRQLREGTETSEIVAAISTRFDGSALAEVGGILKTFLLEAQNAVKVGVASKDQIETAIGYVEGILKYLPKSISGRFLFDSVLIRSITDDWSSGGTSLSPCIIPFYGETWAHMTIPLCAEEDKPVRSLDFVHFPSRDEANSVDLLSYPWLLHELGHNLFFRNGAKFANDFYLELERLVKTATLKGIADQGIAKSRTVRALSELESLWMPEASHANWTHELAMDLVGVHTGGPAYIAAFEDVVSEPTVDPYLVKPGHPPYDLRARAIIQGGETLGWNEYLKGLRILVEDWRDSHWSEGRMNRYLSLANDDLLTAVCELTDDLCASSRLPRCCARDISLAEKNFRQGELPEWGTSLLLTAKLVHERNPTGYNDWETSTIQQLIAMITS